MGECTVCKCMCVYLILRLREVGCSFVEATYVPSVQEMKQGGNENIVHLQMTKKARAESEMFIFLCVCVCVIQILFHF